jgi:YggT family protein
MVLDALSQVEVFLDVFTTVYVLVIFAYILTSWIQLPYSLRPVQRFLSDVCDPYLRLWRRLLPFPSGPIDFSPIVAVFGLILLERIVIYVLNRLL